MELGLGVLEWPPKTFWSATPHELTAALEGWSEKKGGKKEGMSEDDLAELEEALEEARRAEGR